MNGAEVRYASNTPGLTPLSSPEQKFWKVGEHRWAEGGER